MDERSEEAYEVVRRDRVVITAVVPTFNEEAHIGACLVSLLNQTGVDGDVEILVVDGGSSDRTATIVRSFPEFGSRIRLIYNPRRLQVHAWNLALREARGEFYAMISAHAEYGPTYFADCLAVMRRSGAAAVGGVQRPYGSNGIERAIAWCMSSSFGIGNARFRYTDREEEADSVFAMFTRRSTVEELGGFDETLPFDEDSDLSYRMRRAGGKIVVSPQIQVRYAVRRSLRALCKQMQRYGYFRRFTQLKHPGRAPLRTYAPAALFAALCLSVLLAATPARAVALIVPGAYAAFLIIAAAASVPRIGPAAAFVPVTVATMHIAYGWGWWRAAVVAARSALAVSTK
jgi:succinoglycan biosynthesis protein ExoA